MTDLEEHRETDVIIRMARETPPEVEDYQRYRDWSEHQVLHNADEFITKYNFHELRDILRKGALLAHDPTNTIYLEELAQRNTRLSSPQSLLRYLVFAVAAVSCGWMLGPYALVGNYYDILEARWVHMMRLAGFLLTIPLGLCLTSRNALLVVGICCLISSLRQLYLGDWMNYWDSDILKSFLLVSDSVHVCTVPVFLAEISGPELRGFLISAWIGYVYLRKASHIAWVTIPLTKEVDRIIFSVRTGRAILQDTFDSEFPIPTAVASLLFLLAMTASPKSPYLLISRGKMHHAFRSLKSLRNNDLAAARDLFRIYYRSEIDRCEIHQTSFSGWQVDATNILRGLLPPAILVLALALLGYHYDISQKTMGLIRPDEPMINNLALIVLCMQFFLPSVGFLKYGLRCGLISITLTGLLASYVMQRSQPPYPYPTAPAIVSHLISQTALFTLTAECLSCYNRRSGVPLIMLLYNSIGLGVESLPDMRPHALSSVYFSALTASGLVLLFLFMMHTWDLHLEEIEAKLAIPLTRLASYRISVEVPYLFQRYILFRDVQCVSFEGSYPCVDEITLNDV